jgi:hypothetical protein
MPIERWCADGGLESQGWAKGAIAKVSILERTDGPGY